MTSYNLTTLKLSKLALVRYIQHFITFANKPLGASHCQVMDAIYPGMHILFLSYPLSRLQAFRQGSPWQGQL